MTLCSVVFNKTEIREQHHLLEIKRLKKTIGTLLDEAGSKTKSEVSYYIYILIVILLSYTSSYN